LLLEELVHKYGLKSTSRMPSREALAMFLYMVGPPQLVRQAENRFERSMETFSHEFNHVLSCVTKLAKDKITPKDPTFSLVHPKVANHRSAPFNNAIGALDDTHVKVAVPFEKVEQYVNMKNEKKLKMYWPSVTLIVASHLLLWGFLAQHMIGQSCRRSLSSMGQRPPSTQR
jgi:hypothetical protein